MKVKERVGSTVELSLNDGRVVSATLVRWSDQYGHTTTKSLASGAIFDIGEYPVPHKGVNGDELKWQEASK